MIKMHELAITKEMIELVKKECQERGIKSLKSIIIELGSLTTYKKDCILYYYDLLREQDELINSAELVVNENDGNEFKLSKIITV